MTETRQPQVRAPNFVHIGGQRCGTTWMYKCLQEHPEVFTSSPKEVCYFSYHYDKGGDWYLDHFRPDAKHKVWGELCPHYLSQTSTSPQGGNISSAHHLHDFSPNCKLICCLRNPIDRAYSHWKAFGEGPFRKFTEENHQNVLGRGLYAKHLKRWFRLFSRKQFLIQLHGSVVEDNESAVREVYSHLGVDPSYKPSWLDQAYNTAIFPRIQKVFHHLGLDFIIEMVRVTALGTWIRQQAYSDKKTDRASRSGMDSEMRKKLAGYYAEPNRELEELLDVDLSQWRRPSTEPSR